MASLLYTVVAGALGLVFVWLSWQVLRTPDGDTAHLAARRLFAFSLLYLFLLFAVILAEWGFSGLVA